MVSSITVIIIAVSKIEALGGNGRGFVGFFGRVLNQVCQVEIIDNQVWLKGHEAAVKKKKEKEKIEDFNLSSKSL